MTPKAREHAKEGERRAPRSQSFTKQTARRLPIPRVPWIVGRKSPGAETILLGHSPDRPEKFPHRSGTSGNGFRCPACEAHRLQECDTVRTRGALATLVLSLAANARIAAAVSDAYVPRSQWKPKVKVSAQVFGGTASAATRSTSCVRRSGLGARVIMTVIGSHGYGGWDRVLETNAARVVDRAGRSVLVVHPLAAKVRAREHVS